MKEEMKEVYEYLQKERDFLASDFKDILRRRDLVIAGILASIAFPFSYFTVAGLVLGSLGVVIFFLLYLYITKSVIPAQQYRISVFSHLLLKIVVLGDKINIESFWHYNDTCQQVYYQVPHRFGESLLDYFVTSFPEFFIDVCKPLNNDPTKGELNPGFSIMVPNSIFPYLKKHWAVDQKKLRKKIPKVYDSL